MWKVTVQTAARQQKIFLPPVDGHTVGTSVSAATLKYSEQLADTVQMLASLSPSRQLCFKGKLTFWQS